MKRLKEYLTGYSGGLEAIEGVVILTLLMFVLVFFMSFLFLLYQQALVVDVANDTATRVAQSYAYPQTDPVMGFINRTMKATLSPYRYWGSTLKNSNALKGEKYAKWYLSIASFAFEEGEPSVHIETVPDGLARRHVEVEITASYRIPMGGILQYIGVDPVVTYHTTGRAPCIDLSDYIYTINTTDSMTHLEFGSKALGMVNSLLGLMQSIRNAIKS